MSYVNSVTVYPSSATITKGKWYYGAYASISSNCPECAEVEWYSNSPAIASVNKTTGYIYGVNTGTTRIYAEATDGSGKKDYITVTVTAPVSVTGISVCPTSKSMDVGCTDYLYETIYPSNATNQTVTWCSSDDSVVEVNTYTGFVRAKKAGIVTITATTADGGYSDSCEVWVHGKTPVFLIHGRISNSFDVWGAGNRIFVNPMDTSEADNNHYNSSINALSQGNVQYLYTNKSVQDIFGYQTGQTIKVDGTNVANFTMPGVFNGQFDDGKYTSEHPEGGNLAYYLKSNGYKENINLFVFNYPNEDAVVHSANKFKKYIENLISYVRTSGTNEMKACFYASKCDYIEQNHKINLVGHSMGGLVSRYYVENLGQDNHVDKLITICTPHWGSNLADYSTSLSIKHVLCDHDLDPDSEMYGGKNKDVLHNGCPLWDITDLWTDCTDVEYETTQELLYSGNRETKYYAIAGLDYTADYLPKKDNEFDMSTNFATYQQISDFMFQNKVYKLSGKDSQIINKIDFKNEGDNVVPFLSQIGWTNNSGDSPHKRIQMEKILVIVDANGGNNLVSHLHGKIPHRNCVMENIMLFLSE